MSSDGIYTIFPSCKEVVYAGRAYAVYTVCPYAKQNLSSASMHRFWCANCHAYTAIELHDGNDDCCTFVQQGIFEWLIWFSKTFNSLSLNLSDIMNSISSASFLLSPSSRVYFKSLITLYLLSAILYTSSVFFLLPSLTSIFHFIPLNSIQHLTNHDPSPSTYNLSSTSNLLQITPRLLPGDAHSTPSPDVQIPRQLKGTAVNTDEVVAEDEHSLWTASRSPPSHQLSASNARLVPPRTTVVGFDTSGSGSIQWFPPHHPLAAARPMSDLSAAVRLASESTPEDFFLSKAFADSLGPSKIVPYYHRATGPKRDGNFEANDITITTLVTSNRFKVFAKLVEHYQGAI